MSHNRRNAFRNTALRSATSPSALYLDPKTPIDATCPRHRVSNLTQAASTKTSLVNLGRQIELHETVLGLLELVLHQQGRVGAQTQFNSAAERRGLGEIDQVAQGEGRGHGLVHGECYLLLWLLRLTRLQHHVAATDITLHAEGNALF